VSPFVLPNSLLLAVHDVTRETLFFSPANKQHDVQSPSYLVVSVNFCLLPHASCGCLLIRSESSLLFAESSLTADVVGDFFLLDGSVFRCRSLL